MPTRKEDWAALNLIVELINKGYTLEDIEEYAQNRSQGGGCMARKEKKGVPTYSGKGRGKGQQGHGGCDKPKGTRKGRNPGRNRR